ncbi:nuclease-related domain-containing protein [Neobacillus sp. GCM10023253]|uniref:nuclease-related domain-containing protein n=1 Tax=Neobacillus sp. GCM10023253 TaxID=3252644 RepID=UPI00360E9EE4
MFDELTEQLRCECFILNDLLFTVNNQTFQIDSLIIVPGQIYLCEVKNYEGNYFYELGPESEPESDRLYKLPKTEYTNPLYQLNKSNSLLRQLLQNLGPLPPLFQSVLSEGYPGSDTSTSFSTGFVRRLLGFGHFHLFFNRFCPKVARVRTLSPLFLSVLSEGYPGSDTSISFSIGFVRRLPGFGHFHLFFNRFCPKVARVRTLPPLFQAVLSLKNQKGRFLSLFLKLLFISALPPSTQQETPQTP